MKQSQLPFFWAGLNMINISSKKIRFWLTFLPKRSDFPQSSYFLQIVIMSWFSRWPESLVVGILIIYTFCDKNFDVSKSSLWVHCPEVVPKCPRNWWNPLPCEKNLPLQELMFCPQNSPNQMMTIQYSSHCPQQLHQIPTILSSGLYTFCDKNLMSPNPRLESTVPKLSQNVPGFDESSPCEKISKKFIFSPKYW